MKNCTTCNINKEFIEFHKQKDSKDGFTSICKNCRIIINKQYRINNVELLKQKEKKIREKNKEYYIKYRQEYYIKNKEKLNKINKEYRIKNKKKINRLAVEKRNNNSFLKLKYNTRNLILKSIKKQGYTKNTKTYKILGCTFEEFKQHLENQFTKGMSWENQGKWHLDHIYPISLAKDEKELIRLNHYTNFQPLWAFDNLSKGNKIIDNTQIKLI